MTKAGSGSARRQPRVALTDTMRAYFLKSVFRQSASAFAREKRVPYLLVYNLLHRRIKSLSARNYRKIFGEEPPHQVLKKVEGEFFRKMVDLWVLLNTQVTRADLYQEFYGWKHPQKIDYRIFSGQIQTVEPRLVKIMAQKFSAAGLDEATVRKWIEELLPGKEGTRVPYTAVRPDLLFLQKMAGIAPSRILNQRFQRFESGELRSISEKRAQHINLLRKKAEHMLQAGRNIELEKLREDVSGRRKGFVLYAEVEEELKFLRKYAGKSPRHYLGRSPGAYERAKLKKMAAWRARQIRDACDAFIAQRPHLPLSCLPAASRQAWFNRLLSVLRFRATRLLFQNEGVAFEKKVLAPAHVKKEDYTNGFTRFEIAPRVLGMRKTAFDLMVAENCDIFRGIGTYEDRWYLPELYLEELRSKKFFDLIAAKYEWLAKQGAPAGLPGACLN